LSAMNDKVEARLDSTKLHRRAVHGFYNDD
jgi:hypothetical protein